MSVQFRPVAVALLAAATLLGCGKSEEGKPATQVAAKVNSGEITVHQVNALLAHAANLPPERAREAGRQLLERLIDQELLVQQAQDKRLDRDPKIMQQIEASKREIMARAYLEAVAGTAAKPSQQEIQDYYAKHPELFKERRIYNLREIAIGAKPDMLPKIEEAMRAAKSLNDLTTWLKEQKLPFSVNANVRAAEQLPLELLPRLHQMKDGQTALIPTTNALLVVNIAGSQTQPLDETKATPFIEQFILNQRRGEIAGKEVKRLRESAKIEYVGEFAKAAPAAPAPVPAAPAPAAAPQGAAPAPAGGLGQENIEKGVAGLKK
ncbi:MAG: hypothetical protein OHK0026_11640 [Rhodocyclaceae bacterium]